MAKRISIFSVFNDYDEIESYTVSINGQRKEVPIYKRRIKTTIEEAEDRVKVLRSLFNKSLDGKVTIACNDFKRHLKALKLDLSSPDYDVYQINGLSKDPTEALNLMDECHLKKYQRILARSQVVYQFMEDSGLYVNYDKKYPVYSSDTFTGRSKAKVFNIQGYTADDHIRTPHVEESDILLLFDWISADIRVASILSNDKNLDQAFKESDPYSYMEEKFNQGSESKISRDECKTYLLKVINSMSWVDEPLNNIYPDLATWIRKCDYILNDEEASLTTLLGKQFYIKNAKNKLAVLNGTMQGSVAHAMQNTLIQLYKIIPHRIVCDIHDSLVINSPPNNKDINRYINIVADIMRQPLQGLTTKDCTFPIKVSIGKKWKKWKYLRTIR